MLKNLTHPTNGKLRITDISNRLYQGELKAPTGESSDPVRDKYSNFESKAALLEEGLTKDLPHQDNQTFPDGYTADSDPAVGSINNDRSGFQAHYEGDTKNGKFQTANAHSRSQTVQTVIFQEDSIVDIKMREDWFGGRIEGQLTYIDRQDLSKSYTRDLPQEWLLAPEK
jgi:hypothetical protein